MSDGSSTFGALWRRAGDWQEYDYILLEDELIRIAARHHAAIQGYQQLCEEGGGQRVTISSQRVRRRGQYRNRRTLLRNRH